MRSMGRGLHNFIRDLKNCNKPDQELKRVQEELAKIRQKFRSGGATGPPRACRAATHHTPYAENSRYLVN